MSLYVKFAGLTGSVTTTGFQGWSEVNEMEAGAVNVPVHNTVGKQSDRVQGHPTMGNVLLIKPMDNASIQLLGQAQTGQSFSTVEIDSVSTGNPPQAYHKLILSDATIAHYSRRHSGAGGKPLEYISLTYSKIQETYIPRNGANQAGNPMSTGYDLTKAQKM